MSIQQNKLEEAEIQRSDNLLPLALRAYAVTGQDKGKSVQQFRSLDEPSDWSVVLDAETLTDETQALRFGTYQVYETHRLEEAGFFFDPDTLGRDELKTLQNYAAKHGYRVLTRSEFVEGIIYDIGHNLGATIIGLNLPFDLSRLAIDQGASRGRLYGGFTFQLSPNPWRAAIRIKHLTSRQALISFAPPRPDISRGERKRKLNAISRPGFFVDVRTLAASLTSQSHSLASLSQHLFGENRKIDSEEHGGLLSESYLEYAMNDTQVTWDCYVALTAQYKTYGLKKTPLHRLFSEASLGKAYLKEMGLGSLRDQQPDFPPHIFGLIMSTYYGGRAEIHIRRQIARVLYCDFLSMYPTVCTLMKLWSFVIAEGVNWQDATEETQTLLENVTLPDLGKAEFWQNLAVLVQIEPDSDILPVRSRYDNAAWTIGVNYLKHDQPLWYTLADCIASKILCGKAPKVLKALRCIPNGVQKNLKPISINGDPAFTVHPVQDDFYKRIIDLRSKAKQGRDKARKEGRTQDAVQLDTKQLALKICANATSYGIFVELIVNRQTQPTEVECFGAEDASFTAKVNNVEKPGSFFNPLLATLITGAARLMLAIAENLAEAEGLSWAFCDTDSMALARPDGMSDKEFLKRAQRITNWFTDLNPYEVKEPLFKIEDANYRLGSSKDHEQLYCLCISSKRYVLFNLDAQGNPIIRKASAHGLGHWRPPYQDSDAPNTIPAPSVDLRDIGAERWQYDLWYKIIVSARGGNPDQVDLSYHPALDLPAVSRYGATTPALLKWFSRFNKNKSYREQVKPFNFLLMFQVSKAALQATYVNDNADDLDDWFHELPAVVAPYDTDHQRAALKAYDRKTGKAAKADILQSYRDGLAQYHLHPETKFENGDYLDRGFTRRRHIQLLQVEYIGKEANRWQEQFYTGLNPDAQISYGISPQGRDSMAAQLRTELQKFSQRKIAKAAGMSLRDVSILINGTGKLSARMLVKISQALRMLQAEESSP